MAKSIDAPSQDYTNRMQVGVKGEIIINAGIYKGRYASRVEDVKGDGDLVGFAHPLMNGALLPAYRDLNFDFVMEDGSALYVFMMAVKRADTQSGIPIMWAYLAGEPERIQRRRFLRVSCFWSIQIFHIGQELRSPMSAKWLPAKAIDVSLGGYRFKLLRADAEDLGFEMEDRVLVFFTLSGKQYLMSGRVTRVIPSFDAWEVGVGFDSVSSIMEKKLFEYIRQQEIIWRDE